MSETPGKSVTPTPGAPASPGAPQPVATLVSQQSGTNFTTPQYEASGYSGSSFSHPFTILPPSGTTFPASTPNFITVTASDNMGADTGTQSNVSSGPNQVNVTAGASTTRPGGLGTGLKITIVIGYAPGDSM